MNLFIVILNFVLVKSKLNIIYVTDNKNNLADRGFELATNATQNQQNVTILKPTENMDDERFLLQICETYETLIKNNQTPIFMLDSTSGLVSTGVKIIASSLAIPIVSTSFNLDDIADWDSEYLVHILPPSESILQLVRHIVRYQNMTTAAVLVSELYDIDYIMKTLLQNLPTRHIITALTRDSNIDLLLQIKKKKLFNIFVIGTIDNIQTILEGAEAINMLSIFYSFHGITHERGVLTVNIEKANVFYARTFFNGSLCEGCNNKTYLFQKFYFEVALSAINAAHNLYKTMENSSYSYITCNEYNGNNTPTRNNTDLFKYFVYELYKVWDNESFTLNEKRRITMNTKMVFQIIKFREGTRYLYPLGYWKGGFENLPVFTDENGLKKLITKIEYRVVTNIYPPFVYFNRDTGKYKGLCIDLLDEIAKRLKFQYTITSIEDGQVGLLQEDGSWNGMINELVSKRADIALGVMTMTSTRRAVVDFTVPFYEMVGQSIVMKKWSTPTNYFRFLQVFGSEIWITVIIIYMCSSVFLCCLFKMSPFGNRFVKSTLNKYNLREFTLYECFWFCSTCFTRMGSGETPCNASGRFFTAAWWLFTFALVCAYCANLSAVLTVTKFKSTINNLDDLQNQVAVEYSIIKGTDTYNYFKRMASIEQRLSSIWNDIVLNDNLSVIARSKLSVWQYPLSRKYTNLWLQMETTGFLNNASEALERVRSSHNENDGFAFITSSIDARYYELTSCDLEQISEFSKRPLAFAVQKGSHLKEQLSNKILDLSNTRVLANFTEKWWDSNPNRVFCQGDVDTETVGFENIAGVFIYLGTASSILVLILIIEFIWFTYKKSKNRQRKTR